METELLYLKDSYLKTFSASVVRSEGRSLILDRTAFYPGGGGQPCDMGSMIFNSGKTLKVIEVKKMSGEIVHVLAGEPDGTSVNASIDWERRYRLMKLHTSIHLMDGIIRRDFGHGYITGGQIYEDRARVDLDFPELTRELAQKIEASTNEEISKGLEVRVKYISKEEALKMPDIARTKPGRELLERLDEVRIVEIVGLDMQMDGGTHVRDIKEIGNISIVKFENKGSHSKRLEIKVSGT
ncbi:MAG: alanyl-tRNA editing protein [Nitrososphaerota archaeon]|nr:alanyl-tRNA editing protein [Nitrososphaerota archaeon]MDG6930948.1 alanyl-tRNA editing protein [Nitrososphaerota archaeon]